MVHILTELFGGFISWWGDIFRKSKNRNCVEDKLNKKTTIQSLPKEDWLNGLPQKPGKKYSPGFEKDVKKKTKKITSRMENLLIPLFEEMNQRLCAGEGQIVLDIDDADIDIDQTLSHIPPFR